MIDLDLFSDTCAYCYSGIEDGLELCSTGEAVCPVHREMHVSKHGYKVLYHVSRVENEDIKVESQTGESKEEEEQLQERIKEALKEKKEKAVGGVKCSHITECKNVELVVNAKEAMCSKCDVKDNLWICLDCGHIGCGRKQTGIPGNGHALEHFEETCSTAARIEEAHANTVSLSTISNRTGDTFCYLCGDYVMNPLELQIQLDNDPKQTSSHVSTVSDILGITNESQNCYISAGLQLLGEAMQVEDMEEHVQVCMSQPQECICCQMIKILREMHGTRNTVKSVRIRGFLNTVFQNMPIFARNRQEDCIEFLQALLEQLNTFEECMLLAGATERFRFAVETRMNCTVCGCSSCDKQQDRILNLPFTESVQASIQQGLENRKCCGKQMEGNSVFTKLPEYLILNISRFNSEYKKIESPVKTRTLYLKAPEGVQSYELVGCVVHKGKDIDSGHYIWWVRKGTGEFVADDAVVTRSTGEYSENGTIFLYRRKDN